MESIDVSAKTLEEAITKACIELGAASEEIEYEIIENGANGIFGMIGARPYVIRARVKEAITGSDLIGEAVTEPEPAAAAPEDAFAAETGHRDTANVSSIEEQALSFLSSVFEGMQIDVSIESSYDEKEHVLSLNLLGDDMGVLIGKRGQTLDALQYLTSQVVNRTLNEYVRVKLDTENYRERREETLVSLARNIAYKVRRTRRNIALEPMNPYERRIIHSALQNERDVSTRSEGEEPYRHVVVFYTRRNGGR